MKQPINIKTTTTPMSSNGIRGTLLVVDDTPENLTVLRKCLTDHQYRVAVARNGRVALERVKRIRPDLILLDVLMPGMDGFEVCRQLKQDDMDRSIPVIFMTALATAEDKVKGFEAGAEDYVTKPLNNQEVLARVHTHITLYKVQQQLRTQNAELQSALERERRILEDLRMNLSVTLSHELHTPLTGILGFCEILLDKLPKSHDMAEYAAGIYRSGLQLHHLINNVLLYAKLNILNHLPGEERPVKEEEGVWVKPTIEQIAFQKAREVRRQHDLVLDVRDNKLKISPDNLEKILEEVLDNAFKFSLPGTSVRVSTTREEHHCILTISDQGCGMTPEQIAQIEAYTQFDRWQREQQGLGLGNIIASLLTLWEGGKLSIISEPGQGTTVSIRFPLP